MNAQAGIGIGIAGGTGYGAAELARLLVQHPAAEIVSVSSTSAAGKKLEEIHPHLAGFCAAVLEDQLDLERLAGCRQAVVFLALPHGASAQAVQTILASPFAPRIKIIDLSGDLRLKDADQHRKFYPESPFLAPVRSRFVYGLPEINQSLIAAAQCAANPGCYATACALAARPFIPDGFSGRIIFDAKSGTSGAGRSLREETHHPQQHANFAAYKVLEHRHEPEIAQTLGDPRGGALQISFVPHLLPLSRGIEVTAYIDGLEECGPAALLRRLEEAYAGCPFVRVRRRPPELAHVVGSNFCDVFATARGAQVVAMAALDNLVKGMAGQAVQNMNLMTGLPETTGLWHPPLGLV